MIVDWRFSLHLKFTENESIENFHQNFQKKNSKRIRPSYNTREIKHKSFFSKQFGQILNFTSTWS